MYEHIYFLYTIDEISGTVRLYDININLLEEYKISAQNILPGSTYEFNFVKTSNEVTVVEFIETSLEGIGISGN